MTRFRSVAEPSQSRDTWVWILGLMLLGALMLTLAGCPNTTSGQRTTIAQLSVAEACDAYAGALNVLAPQRAAGWLSTHDIETVDRLNAAVDPICLSKAPPTDPIDAAAQVSTAVTQAMVIFYGHQQKGS